MEISVRPETYKSYHLFKYLISKIDMEQTLCILKPDAIRRSLESDVYKRINSFGLKIYHLYRTILTENDINFLYGSHKDEWYYPEILDFMGYYYSEISIIEGKNSIGLMNKIIGFTDPSKAKNGTIRGDFYIEKRIFPQFPNIYQNIIHSSSKRRAKEEIIFFAE